MTKQAETCLLSTLALINDLPIQTDRLRFVNFRTFFLCIRYITEKSLNHFRNSESQPSVYFQFQHKRNSAARDIGAWLDIMLGNIPACNVIFPRSAISPNSEYFFCPPRSIQVET